MSVSVPGMWIFGMLIVGIEKVIEFQPRITALSGFLIAFHVEAAEGVPPGGRAVAELMSSNLPFTQL